MTGDELVAAVAAIRLGVFRPWTRTLLLTSVAAIESREAMTMSLSRLGSGDPALPVRFVV